VEKFELARFELGQSLIEFFNTYSMPGITENNSAYKQSIVTCSNANIHCAGHKPCRGTRQGIYMQDDCHNTRGRQYMIEAVKDRLLYSMLAS